MTRTTCFHNSADQIAAGVSPARLDRVSNWMADHVASGRLAGLAVQIKRRGQVVYDGLSGVMDVTSQTPVARDTLWRIYSMTKPFTSVAALSLYEEGAFQLDQPVADFLPEFANLRVWKGQGHALTDTAPLSRAVTIHDLMTHQSGIMYGNAQGDALEQALFEAGLDLGREGDTMADAVARLTQLPLAFQPGARWCYGLGTDVLGHLLERITGQNLSEIFRTRVFDPLGMHDTAFGYRPDQTSQLATLYSADGDGFARTPNQGATPNDKVTMMAGGQGLLSTMADYQRFVDMLLAGGMGPDGPIIGRKTFELMTQNHMGGDLASRGQAHFSETTMHGIGFGLGVSVMLDPARAKILGTPGEFAWGGAASTAFWVDPAEDLTVILMTQLLPSSYYTLRRQLRVLAYQSLLD